MTGKIHQPFDSPKVDLHIHSERSDGSFTSQAIIDYAFKIGLKAISITDHDDISGLEFSMQYCQQQGIEFITGVEISAVPDHMISICSVIFLITKINS